MSLPKYYQLLGLSNKDPSESELKKAYKKAALKHHPDRNQENKEEAEKKFKEVAEAYSVLNDKNKKHIYDTLGEDGLKNGGHHEYNFPGMDSSNIFSNGNGSTFVFTSSNGFNNSGDNFMNIDPHDIFSQLFSNDDLDFSNNFTNFNDRRKYNNFQKEVKFSLPCSLEELYNGKNKKLKITRTDYLNNVVTEKFLKVKIQPGWKSGTKVKFNGEGDILPDGTKQDIIVNITEKSHNWFKRDGDDLFCDINLTEKHRSKHEIKLSIPTLDNRTLSFNLKLIEISAIKIIENEGMPIRNKGNIIGKGNLIISLKSDK